MTFWRYLKMKKVEATKMTNSKMQKETLKHYKHALITKEDLNPFWTHGVSDKLKAQLDIVRSHDVPFCLHCKKFAGDLVGRCTGLKLEPEEPKIQPIKMGYIVDTDEAQHWIEAERFDYIDGYFRMFKGVKMVAMFSKKYVNYIKMSEQPHIILGSNVVHGNHI